MRKGINGGKLRLDRGAGLIADAVDAARNLPVFVSTGPTIYNQWCKLKFCDAFCVGARYIAPYKDILAR